MSLPENDIEFSPIARELIERARIEGLRVWLEIIDQRWSSTPRALQDLCARALGASLGPGFDYLGLDDWSCGPYENSIPAFRQRSTKILFQAIPGGEGHFGSSLGNGLFGTDPEEGGPDLDPDPDESPQFRAQLGSFLLARTPLTRGQWHRLAAGTALEVPAGDEDPERALHGISWSMAAAWLARAGLRFPKETEWEYAGRAGSTSRWCFGDDVEELSKYLSLGLDLEDGPGAPGLLAANAFGLFDMHGLVAEPCAELWWLYPDQPPAPNENRRVLRGGSWLDEEPNPTRSAARRAWGQEQASPDMGLRPALDWPRA